MDTAIFAMNEDAVAADITSHMGGEEACYDFGDGGCLSRGTIMTKPALFGIHPCHGGVMVIFGGYGGSFEIGDWAVKGTLICRAPDMTPSPHSGPANYPIGQIRKDDPATAETLSELVSTVADHYAEHYTGNGLH